MVSIAAALKMGMNVSLKSRQGGNCKRKELGV